MRRVAIGVHYLGVHLCWRNAATGEYREVYPPIEGDALMLQRALLARI